MDPFFTGRMLMTFLCISSQICMGNQQERIPDEVLCTREDSYLLSSTENETRQT
jgi:hypothetical protein